VQVGGGAAACLRALSQTGIQVICNTESALQKDKKIKSAVQKESTVKQA